MASTFDALFNAEYLPAKLLHRNQELEILSKHLNAEETLSHPMNILVHGSFGVGRTTLLRFFGQQELSAFHRPIIRFQQKEPHEIVSDALSALVPACPLSFSLPEKWTLMKRLVRKAEVPLLFTLDDIDSNTIQLYGKFLQVCKENHISTMATAPRYFPRQLKADLSQFLDFSLELTPFTDHQFLDIVTQRVTEVFPQPIPAQAIEFMSDLICLLDFQRPATIVELLQNLHPLLYDPNHITAQFPTDCASCHSENAWEPSTFDHDGQYFAIYSGRHRGEWDQCVDCHTSPSNFTVFSCLDCHEHNNKSEVDSHHSEVRGYAYTSQACLSCQPRYQNSHLFL